jgi:predicted negative regulator of RcsB-dependent stress response
VTELEDKASRRDKRREQQQNASNEPTKEEVSRAIVPDSKSSDVDSSKGEGPSSGGSDAIKEIRDRNARVRAQAAAQRRAKNERENAAVALPVGLDAAERIDDIFVRTTHAAAGWVHKNFKWLQWVVILSVAGGFGFQSYRYVTRSKAAKSTDALVIGLNAEGGTVRPTTDDEQNALNPELAKLDPRPVYQTEQARIAAAEEGYRKAEKAYAKTGAGWVARLGLAGVLYDQQKWDEALSQYRAVRSSEVAKLDPDILARSIEGTGLCLEAKGDRAGALTAYRELTNQDAAPWLSTLGLYHQARMLLADGNREKAKELATKAKERLDKEAKDLESADKNAIPRPGYLSESVKMLLTRIDPTTATAAAAPNIEEALKQDPAKLQKLIDELQKQQPPAAPSAPGGKP